MHKLTRTPSEPSALAAARESKTPDWEHFSSSEKKTVRDELLLMQDFRCAYCERQLHDSGGDDQDKWDGHIEHFRRKNQNFHPELTFVWENLFYSCLINATCGKRKDDYVKNKKQYPLLIDPCKDNPEDFFVFDGQGRIVVRSPIPDAAKERAEFTIEAFGLNDPKLVADRYGNLLRHSWMEQELAKWDEAFAQSQLEEYLVAIQKCPFVTTIYHYFGKRFIS